jgi:hypothetical protein
MFLTEIYESKQSKHAAFCFGRMNPPTIGHGKLLATTHKAAQGGDYFIFLSHTQDRKDNPLDYNTKAQFVKRMFPKHADHVSVGGLRTIMDIAGFLYDHGYTHVTFVAGSDRLESFQKLLTSYNGVEGKNVYYKFAKIDFISSGDREDGAEGVEGVSASQARAAALANNMEAFTQATGAGRLAPKLFKAVRAGMGLTESQVDEHIVKHGSQYRILSKKTGKNMGTFPSKAAAEKHEREIQYFKHANEDASGYIPKNKKEANDPRWSNALSVDVTPATPYKNAKALRLV